MFTRTSALSSFFEGAMIGVRYSIAFGLGLNLGIKIKTLEYEEKLKHIELKK